MTDRRPRPLRPALVAAAVLLGTGACGPSSGTTSTPTSVGAATTTPAGSATVGSTTAPATASTEAPSGGRALVIAHRGASADAPEHTFASWDRAVDQGADYLEIDLQITADGELVVLHDTTLDRVARGPAENCTGEVSSKTVAQLATCEVGSWFNDSHPDLADPSFAEQKIPTLAAVLDRYGHDRRYYIETKVAGAGMEQPLVDLLRARSLVGPGARERQVILQSFAPESLQALRAIDPDLTLVQLLVGTPDAVTGTSLDAVARYADGIGPSATVVDASVVAAAHERCLDVHPYTVDDPAVMATLLDAGVDGLFTNTPDTLVTAATAHTPPPSHCRRG